MEAPRSGSGTEKQSQIFPTVPEAQEKFRRPGLMYFAHGRAAYLFPQFSGHGFDEEDIHGHGTEIR
jgi:hypothetical protein